MGQIKMNFTQKAIDNIVPPTSGRQTYADTKAAYLRLRVSAAGNKVFYYVRRIDSKIEWLKLDSFPGMTVHKARERSMEISGEIAQGIDPRDTNKKRRESITFSELFKYYMDVHSKPRKKSAWLDDTIFRKHLVPLHSKKVASISNKNIVKLHNTVGEKRGKTIANRMLSMLRSVFNVAIKHGLYEGQNPTTGIKKFKEKSRDRFMDGEELQRFFKALETEPNPLMKDFFMLALFTGARRGNLQAMKWRDIDLDRKIWTIPGEEFKNGEPMKVVLAPPALDILNNRKKAHGNGSDYVFPAQRVDSKTPHLTEPKKAWRNLCKRAGLENLRIHDLRRTFGSWQAAHGASLQIIGKSLGHLNQQTTEIYSRLNIDPIRESVMTAVESMFSQSKEMKTDEQ